MCNWNTRMRREKEQKGILTKTESFLHWIKDIRCKK
jgi:hypothetical protein